MIHNKNTRDNTTNIILINNSINRLISNKRVDLENWFLTIKFPIFEYNFLFIFLEEAQSILF